MTHTDRTRARCSVEFPGGGMVLGLKFKQSQSRSLQCPKLLDEQHLLKQNETCRRLLRDSQRAAAELAFRLLGRAISHANGCVKYLPMQRAQRARMQSASEAPLPARHPPRAPPC